ncbi:Leucine-rich repeat (LRR) family protein [Forsythia ovata]
MESNCRDQETSQLVSMCIEVATESAVAVETWRRQRRTLERMPSHLADALLHRLLRRRLLFPSLLEVFKYNVEEIDLKGENCVDAEWMAYLGAFRYLRSLNLAYCRRINNSSLWSISGMTNLKELDLSRCSKITDAGIEHLLSIPALEKLCISETGVTADGVALLTSLTNLLILDLGGLPVTDSALSSLQVLSKLQYLDLWGSEVSNEGAALLKVFPGLSFLNLAWTNVTKLPNLFSLTCLNMSNCTIHSLFKEEGCRAHLEKLIISGATITDVHDTFLHVEASCLSYLDLSNSSVPSFCFLPSMKAITHLNLSGSLVVDDSINDIASVGANLRYLNLSNTKISCAGVALLAGHVPCLETILLSCTSIDDTAISYIGMMASLKVANLSCTNVKGFIHQDGNESDWVPSFSALQNLSYLERLELDEIQMQDAALCPLTSLGRLSYLSLGSGILTDASFYHVSSIPRLKSLGIRDAVLTDTGLDSFVPPPTLEVLDLRGCWLLTEDVLSFFCQKYPQIEVKHELVSTSTTEKRNSSFLSPDKATARSLQYKHKQGKLSVLSPLQFGGDTFLDQRLKYSREDLLSLQFSSASFSISTNQGNQNPQ